MSESLKRYAQLQMELLEIQDELRGLEKQIQLEVEQSGNPIEAVGFVARIRPGRMQTDHLQAALDANASEAVIQKYSTTKTTVAWAKVTKELGCNLQPYTVQGPATLEIKPII